MDLVEFVRDRLNEDEQGDAVPHYRDCQMMTSPPLGFPFDTFSCNCDGPARLLREEEAKRRIVDLHGKEPHECPEWDGDWVYTGYKGLGECLTLKLLALAYDSHPDYQESWRP